jgi:hypothetical protein
MVMATKREALWRFVVETKYDSLRGGWGSKKVVGPFGIGVWTNMRGGEFSRILLDTRWEIGPRSGFGVICGVGTNPKDIFSKLV